MKHLVGVGLSKSWTEVSVRREFKTWLMIRVRGGAKVTVVNGNEVHVTERRSGKGKG